jgi:APA family basic amino acid/polyamine antiporter
MLFYAIAGLACIFAALCYAEFASMAPIAGSAYTYAYVTMGELFAWIIGWDLVLEYAVGASTVASGWSSYFMSILAKVGIAAPFVFSGPPHKYDQGHILRNEMAQVSRSAFVYDISSEFADETTLPVRRKVINSENAQWADGSIRPANGIYWVLAKDVNKTTVLLAADGDQSFESSLTNRQAAVVNLPAVLVALLITAVLVKGIKESAGFNALMVAIKVLAVMFVIFVGAFYVNPANWTDNFAPYGWTGVSFFGIPVLGQTDASGAPVGMLAGAAIIFFAYIGFDAVSTQAEEARNPQRDVPIAIIASLVVCTFLYIGVVAVLTGMVPYLQIDKEAGVSKAFEAVGLEWAEVVVAVAGVAGITSVLLVMMLSGPRVFLAMARDGLVPKSLFANVHPTFRTPWISTILVGLAVAAMSGLLPIDALLHLTNIGTFFAFVIVCAAVLVMRKINPEADRPFRCPLVPFVPLAGIGLCLLLMLSLPAANWWRLIAWLLIGLAMYFVFGYWNSKLGRTLRQQDAIQSSQ